MTLESLSWVHRADILLVATILVLLAFAPRLERTPVVTTVIGCLGALAALACGLQESGLVRYGLVVSAVLMVIAHLLTPSAELFDGRQRPEAAALIVVGGLGAIVLVTGATLLEMALGVELLSLSGAALVALGRGQRPLEGGFKYFVLTAVTFATFLFGMALVFVGTGSLDVPQLTDAVGRMAPLVSAGAALMVLGLAFKLALVPVHFGALDAYTAGPASFVGFVMMVSKVGAAIALGRLAVAMGAGIETLLLGAGLVTMAFGVVASFAQTDLRRLLAYSAVAHAGFLGVAAGSPVGGQQVVLFYLVSYGVAAVLAFAALAGTGTEGFSVSRLGHKTHGLGPIRSLALLLALLSLAGVPPLPGFWAKLAVLRAVWDSYGLLPTALAALAGVVGIIYYLAPMPDLLAAVFAKREGQTALPVGEKKGAAATAGVLALVLVALGLAPGLVWWFSI